MTSRVIDCGRLIDGTDSAPVDDARLVVEDGRVSATGDRETISVPDDADHLEFPAATVIPGLIDAHLHLTGGRTMDPMSWVHESTELGAIRATRDLERLLAAGFTTVRDVGSKTGIALREAVEAGEVPGPRIYTSGQGMTQTGGHGDSHMLPYDWVTGGDGICMIADGADECRKAARRFVREGVDLIKMSTTGGVLSEKDHPEQSQFTDDEIAAVTQEAHRVGIPVAAHAQGASGIKNALRNGVDTIEHGIYVDREGIELLLENDAVMSPTLAIVDRICEHGADHGVPEYGLEKAREVREAHFDAVRRADDAGVKIAAGTDFIGPELVPHGENVLELELYVEECGMDEHDAIRTATGVAAEAFQHEGRPDLGTLEEGNRADFVVLEEDPLADIAALRSIAAVYKDGEAVEV